MNVNTDNLKRVSTYARKAKVSVTSVLTWAKKREIQIVNIDGVKFVNDDGKGRVTKIIVR